MKSATTWELNGKSYEIEFEYRYGAPGFRYCRNGDPGEPPEGDEIEIEQIRDESNNEIIHHDNWEAVGFTEEQFESLEKSIYDNPPEYEGPDDPTYF